MTKKTSDEAVIIDLDPDQVIEAESETVSATASAAPLLPKRRTYSRWALPLAGLLLAGLGGGWLYRDVLSVYYPSDRMTAVLERAVALEKSNEALAASLQAIERLANQLKLDVDALETKSSDATATAQDVREKLKGTEVQVAGLQTGLQQTQKSLADLTQKIGSGVVTAPGGGPVDSGALNDLALRLDNLEKDVAALKASKSLVADTSVLTQSLSDLKAKVAAGAVYDVELARIQRLVPAVAGLDVLAQHGRAGVPNAKGLAAELNLLIAELPKPTIAVVGSPDDSYWTQAWHVMSDLIKIRNTGEIDWSITAAAAAALAETGDLVQAIEHINKVEGEKPPALQRWIERAAARLGVEAALQSVEDGVLRVLSAQKAQ